MPIKNKKQFNPNHSELETNSKKTEKYAQLIEKELKNDFIVEGILEIGSYAKGEAVPSSDLDTRIYVSSPKCYLNQTIGRHINEKKTKEAEKKFSDFLQKNKI